MAIRTIALAAPATKGATQPAPGQLRYTRNKVRAIVGRWEKLGKARTVGRNKGTRQILSVTNLHDNTSESAYSSVGNIGYTGRHEE